MPRFAIWVLLLFLSIPSLYLYSKNLDSNALLLSMVLIVYAWALAKNSRYLVILYPIVLIVPIILFYVHFYESSINEQVLSIILETDSQEALGFLGANIYIYIGLFLIWTTVVTILFWQNHRRPTVWSHRSRWWIAAAVSSFALIGIASNQLLAADINANFSETDNFLVDEKNGLLQDLKNTYPLGLFISLNELYEEQAKINAAFSQHQQFRFQATSSNESTSKQLMVLVIGETSRRANWQLNGYSRPTNPKLSKQPNLVNFSNMLSLSAATRSSIPMMITRKPDVQVYQYDFPEKSLISAFKEAGFTTYWVSTQQKFGAHDTSTSVYAKEADHVIFLNKTNYKNKGDTDGVVLPVFNQILNSSTQKTLVVIHTLGSHFDYSHRYPPNFDKFKPSLNDVSGYSLQDKKYKAQLINSYDNSILYTDYVLDGLINAMKTKPQIDSFLLYSSDHGEDLFDGQCDKSGHGNETVYNFEIASLAWYSDSFARHHRDKVQALLQNKHQKINQTAIFPTLIDAASIDIPNDPLTRSLLKVQSSYPRLVLGSVDFDKHSPKGICKEMQ